MGHRQYFWYMILYEFTMQTYSNSLDSKLLKPRPRLILGSIFFLWKKIESSCCTQRVLMTWGCVMSLCNLKVTGRKSTVRNLCLLYTFLMQAQWKFLFHALIVYDLRMLNDFDLGSFGKGQGNWKKKCLIAVWSVSFLQTKIGSSYFTQRVRVIWGCFVILTWGHLRRFRVSRR